MWSTKNKFPTRQIGLYRENVHGNCINDRRFLPLLRFKSKSLLLILIFHYEGSDSEIINSNNL